MGVQNNGRTTTTPTPTPSPSMAPSQSYGGTNSGGSSSGGSSYGGMPSNAKTVIEGPGNSFAFMPSTITVKRGAMLTLNNVSDTAHTFTMTGQGIDVETQPGRTSRVTIGLKPGSYSFFCRFHQSLGMTGTLVVKT